MSKILAASDLHLDKDPHHEYRWDLFPQLKKIIKKKKIDHVIISGDLTDSKDNHGAKLVNRIVDELVDLMLCLPEEGNIWVLSGNHDSIDNTCPYFKFLDKYPNITFIDTPQHIPVDDRDLYFLPHSRHPMKEWKKAQLKDTITFAHVMVDGAFAESGIKLDSDVPSSFFDECLLAFSGDIHKPQEVGPLIYIGAPYETRFGSNYEGGCIVLDTKTLKWERIVLDFPRNITIVATSANDLKVSIERMKQLYPKTHVKVRLHITSMNIGEDRKLQQVARELLGGSDYILESFDIKNDFKTALPTSSMEGRKVSDFDSYCELQKVSDRLKAVGKALMDEVSA